MLHSAPLSGWAPLALGFRPLFLLASWFAIFFMLISLGGFVSGIWHYNYFELSLWHAHEMLFGFAAAVVAGFLLTAVRNWTGLATPTGWALAGLVLLWLVPRIASATPVPPLLFALSDMLFLPTVALVIFLRLHQAKQPHNYSVPALLLLLGASNAGIHLGVLEVVPGIAAPMLLLATLIFVSIIVLIGGRVLPFFIGRATGSQTASNRMVEKLALPVVLLFAAAQLMELPPMITATVALLCALLHGMRLHGWYTACIWKEPMLWVLWLAYGWLVAGFLAFAVAQLFEHGTVEAMHAWTVGAVGMFTLGMMARVSLGHTGRPITSLPWMPTAFGLVMVAAAIRAVIPPVVPDWLHAAVIISAVCWTIAFLIFSIRYSALLLRPRLDGKEG